MSRGHGSHQREILERLKQHGWLWLVDLPYRSPADRTSYWRALRALRVPLVGVGLIERVGVQRREVFDDFASAGVDRPEMPAAETSVVIDAGGTLHPQPVDIGRRTPRAARGHSTLRYAPHTRSEIRSLLHGVVRKTVGRTERVSGTASVGFVPLEPLLDVSHYSDDFHRLPNAAVGTNPLCAVRSARSLPIRQAHHDRALTSSTRQRKRKLFRQWHGNTATDARRDVTVLLRVEIVGKIAYLRRHAHAGRRTRKPRNGAVRRRMCGDGWVPHIQWPSAPVTGGHDR